MILVWGIKSYVRLLGIMTFVCGACHNPAAQRVEQLVRKFTLFWIPLFPIKRQTHVTCTFCGTTIALTKDQAAALLRDLEAAQNAPGQPGTGSPMPSVNTSMHSTPTRPPVQDVTPEQKQLPASEF